jgi:hypothetical protein
MGKRPSGSSLFAAPEPPTIAAPRKFLPKGKRAGEPGKTMPELAVPLASVTSPASRPPSRAGKRVLSIYIDPVAWKQLRQLALDTGTSTQALGEEAINLLFTQRGLNRRA